MKESFSIEEILSAVDEIQKKKEEIKIKTIKNSAVQKNFSEVPKSTLKLIEEAENNK